MGNRLNGRVALVTGAGAGRGKACALSLAAEGALVVVNDLGSDEPSGGHRTDAADRTVGEIGMAGGIAVASYQSSTTFEGVVGAVSVALEAFGPIDIVVACTMAIPDGLFPSDAAYRRIIDAALSEKFWLARETLPGMAERRYGRFIAVTSRDTLGQTGNPVGAAATGGMISYTKAIAANLRDRGVTANCLMAELAAKEAPRPSVSLIRGRRERKISEDMWVASGPYLGSTADAASLATWLCTDAAAGVTGQVFTAYSGKIGRWSDYSEVRSVYRGDPLFSPLWSLDDLDQITEQLLS